jgi:hypothetical protein
MTAAAGAHRQRPGEGGRPRSPVATQAWRVARTPRSPSWPRQSYVCRMLRLTLLPPDMVEAILGWAAIANLELKLLLKSLSR